MEQALNLAFDNMHDVYVLYIKFNNLSHSIKQQYVTSIREHNKITKKYYRTNQKVFHDAGFDLFCPAYQRIENGTLGNKIPLDVECGMYKLEKDNETDSILYKPVNYLLVPRSSTGTKTPLRMSNSIGVIDSGYRGVITGVVDNINWNGKWKAPSPNNYDDVFPDNYIVNAGDRLFQIISPQLSLPYYINIVDDFEEVTERGTGGFGSTGV